MHSQRSPLALGVVAVIALVAAAALFNRVVADTSTDLPGDVNCDEVVNSIDAALILQYSAGLIGSLPCQKVADVDQNGAIDPIDAALILQYDAGLIDSLGPPPATPSPPPTPTQEPTPTPPLSGPQLMVDKFGHGTVTSNPEGVNCGTDCMLQSVQFPAGSTIILTATPDADSSFSWWSGCDSASGNICTVTVDADKTVLATFVLDDAQVPETTKVLDEATMQHLVRQEGSTYYFDPAAAVVAALQPGNVIVSAVGDGLLRKVSAVDVSEQEIAVETTDATLEDAIERGTFVFSEEDSALGGLQSSLALTPQGNVTCVINELRCTVPLNVDLGDGITISGTTSFDADPDIAVSFDGWDWSCLCFPVQELRAIATFQVDTEMTVFAGAQFSLTEEITIPAVTRRWVVFIGPVPVLLELELAVNVGITGQAEAGIESHLSLQNTFTVGGHYLRGSGWNDIINYDRTFSASDPDVTAGGQVRAYVKPVLTGKVYSVPGPYFRVEGYLRLNVDPLQTPWWTLYGGLSAAAGLETEVFGLTVVDFTLPLWEREWPLADKGTVRPPTPTPTATPTRVPPTSTPTRTPTPTPRPGTTTPSPTPSVIWVYETNSSPSSVSVSADGNYIVVGSSEEIYFLNGDGDPLWNYPTDFPIIDVSMTADASYIVAGGSQGAIIPDGIVYSLTNQGDLEWSLESTGVSSVSYSADGNYFAMTHVHWLGWNDVVRLWGDNEGEWLWDYNFGAAGTTAVSLSADGEYIAVGGAADVFGNDGALRLYDKAGDLLWEYAIDTEILAGDKYSVSISTDGKYIAAGNEDNDQLYFFERDQQLLWSYTTGPIEGVSVSADGSRIVAASREKVYIFDRDENLLWEFEISNIEDVAMSADADTIVAVTEDNKVYALSP
ncbi:MAG: PQQ-binding-like beta-propeller repeat protein [Chloroflexi bacterium]|nr:PQQ-binding-like beta-propeller repeat protein [Chloroflexota bacterium]